MGQEDLNGRDETMYTLWRNRPVAELRSCESRGGRPGLPSLIVRMLSVHVKRQKKKKKKEEEEDKSSELRNSVLN